MVVIRRQRKKLFDAETADGLLSKIIGLMGRRKLENGRGMIFSFPFDYKWSMWMFGMRMPLDMIFIDKDKEVVGVERGVKPLSLDPSTWKTTNPDRVCRYVLETSAGESSRKRIKVGDVLTFR